MVLLYLGHLIGHAIDPYLSFLHSVHLSYQYMKDGHYAEMRDMDLLRDRLDVLNTIEPYIGQYFSKKYVQKQVFRMSDDEIDSMQKEMDSETTSGEDEEEY